MTDGSGPANPADLGATWPKDVEPISYANIARLGVGKDDQLYWDGRPVKTKRLLKLDLLQTSLAITVSVATIIGGVGAGVNEGFDFVCKVHWLERGCKP